MYLLPKYIDSVAVSINTFYYIVQILHVYNVNISQWYCLDSKVLLNLVTPLKLHLDVLVCVYFKYIRPNDPHTPCWPSPSTRVLARILKMPVQNSNSKISACPNSATNLLQILKPTTFNSCMCQKGQFTLQSQKMVCLEDIQLFPPNVKIENSSQKILPV